MGIQITLKITNSIVILSHNSLLGLFFFLVSFWSFAYGLALRRRHEGRKTVARIYCMKKDFQLIKKGRHLFCHIN